MVLMESIIIVIRDRLDSHPLVDMVSVRRVVYGHQTRRSLSLSSPSQQLLVDVIKRLSRQLGVGTLRTAVIYRVAIGPTGSTYAACRYVPHNANC